MNDCTYRQWLTTHSLLQYSSSHSALEIAALGQPCRMQALALRMAGWPTAGCCCCCCWTLEETIGAAAETGGELDTMCSLRGGLMRKWDTTGTCTGFTWNTNPSASCWLILNSNARYETNSALGLDNHHHTMYRSTTIPVRALLSHLVCFKHLTFILFYGCSRLH